MRIIEMRPELTPWKDGQHRKVSSWAFRDGDTGQQAVRYIWHYSTLMGCYYGVTLCDMCAQDQHHGERECPRTDLTAPNLAWVFEPLSIGHGSQTDQQGMNQLMGYRYLRRDSGRTFTQDYGYRYDRDIKGGGPRIINLNTGEQILP